MVSGAWGAYNPWSRKKSPQDLVTKQEQHQPQQQQ